MKNKNNLILSISLLILIGFSSCNNNTAELQAKVDSLEKELKEYRDEKATTEQRLVRFDSLDFEFYSKQNWEGFHQSHADNIKAYYPDGSVSEGLDPAHIDIL